MITIDEIEEASDADLIEAFRELESTEGVLSDEEVDLLEAIGEELEERGHDVDSLADFEDEEEEAEEPEEDEDDEFEDEEDCE